MIAFAILSTNARTHARSYARIHERTHARMHKRMHERFLHCMALPCKEMELAARRALCSGAGGGVTLADEELATLQALAKTNHVC